MENPKSDSPNDISSNVMCGGILSGVIAILVISVGTGLAANAVRGTGTINLGRNYFNAPVVSPVGADQQPSPSSVTESNSGETTSVTNQPDDGIQRLTFEEAQDNFIVGEEEFEATGESIYLFVDARVRDQYEDGHIPGAIWLYHYESDSLIDEVRSELEMAFFIIVYCNGGDCEDSLHLAADLMSLYNLPPENIYVYEGGLNEWKERGMPIAVGSERR